LKAIYNLSAIVKRRTKRVIIFFVAYLFAQNVLGQVIISGGSLNARPGTTASIFGSGFSTTTGNDIVYLQTLSTLYNLQVFSATANLLTVFIPAGAPISGKFNVIVNGQFASSPFTFTVLYPTVSSFLPISGDSGDTISIKGKYFSGVTGASSVSFGTTNASSYAVVSDTLIKAVVGSGSTGNVAVTISGIGTPLGGFVYSNIPLVDSSPVINTFTPAAVASWRASAYPITIKGKYFTGTAAVSFCGINASFVVNSDTEIIATMSDNGSPIASPNLKGNVQVITSRGDTTAAGFTYYNLPAIYTATPDTGSIGTSVRIRGINLSNSTGAIFSRIGYLGTPTQITDTAITAILLPLDPSVVGAYVYVADAGESYKAGPLGFVYIPPSVNSFSPTSASFGDTVYIKGYDLSHATFVRFGGVNALSFWTISDTLIAAVVGNAKSGYVTVEIDVAQGPITTVGAPALFTYIPHVAQVCDTLGTASITSIKTGTLYEWQVDTLGNGVYKDISNNANYNGVTTDTLQLTTIPSSWSGYQYRCIVDGTNSNITTLKITDTWTGATSAAWEDPTNWSCDAIPDLNTDVVITSGTIILNSNQIVKSLTLSPTVNFTVGSGHTLTITH